MQFRNHLVLTALVTVLVTSQGRVLSAAEPGFSIDKTESGISIKVGGQPVADYVVNDPATNKTYLWPVYGPSGKEMTRAYPMKDVEGEVKDHFHHRGICFGHEDIGGFDTWAELMTFDKGENTSAANKARIAKLGKQQHRRFNKLAASQDKAIVVSELDYLSTDGKKYLGEVRTMIFSIDGKHRLIDFNQEFTTTDGNVLFADKKDAGLSIRVPTSMSVDTKKGGTIVTSEGLVDAAAWGKRAKWCDYSGPVGDEILGVAILNHPTSFRHPTSWHVRTYGLFTANPFGTLDPASPNGEHTLKVGEKLELRHRFVLHLGDSKSANISQAYERYVGSK